MSPLTMPIAIAAALTMGACIFHALVYMRQQERQEYLFFAIVCLLMVFYDIVSIKLYNATSPEQAFVWLRIRMLLLAPTGTFLIWYLHKYTGHPDKRPVYLFTFYFTSALIIGFAAPGGLLWIEQIPVLRHINLPWGGHMSFYEFALSSFGAFRFSIRIFFLGYFCWVAFWYLRKCNFRKGLAMVASFMVFFAGLANDTAVRLGLYDFPYMLEFSFLGVVMFMTYELANQIVDAAVVRDQLTESEKRYRLLAENISDNVWVVGMDLAFSYVSPSLKGLLGYDPSEVEGMDSQDIMTPEAREIVRNAFVSALEENRQHPDKEVRRNMIVQLIRKDGIPTHIEIKAGFIYDDERKPIGIVGISRDVEAQIVAEKALRESEEKYRRVYENIQDAYFETDLDGIIREVSPSISYMSQYSREELIGRNIRTLSVNPEKREDRLEAMVSMGRINDHEADYIDKDGSIIRTAVSAGFLFDDEGKPCGTVGTLRNIEDRKKAEEALRESETRFRLLAENSTDVIWTMTLGGAFTYVSPSVERLSGFSVEEVMNMTLEDYVTPESYAKANALMAEELVKGPANRIDPVTLEVQQNTKNGGVIDVEVSANWILDESGQPIGVRGATRDIRARKEAEKEKKELEAQLLQARKMEAIGTLAGGIAHDFNNILHPIIGYTQMLLAENGHNDSTNEVLEEILRAANRAKDLVSQILTFGRRSSETKTGVNVNSVIQEALGLLKASIPSTIEIRQDIKNPNGMVHGNSSQLHQVIMNLCTNAYQAMKDTGGILTVGLEQVELTGEGQLITPEMPKGTYLKIYIQDTGPGMAPAVMERIFEPYFTTKEMGDGTGMGLAVVHAIVKKHQGEIRVNSQPKQGTSFEVFLPASEGKPETKSKVIVADVPAGRGRLLVVDDEALALRMTKKSLEMMGYQVTAEQNSLEAMKAFSANPKGFDLVLTDMTMPGLTGEDLARNILAIRPDIPVILCTGYTDHFSHRKIQEIGIIQCLNKPVERHVLAQTLKNVLKGTKR